MVNNLRNIFSPRKTAIGLRMTPMIDMIFLLLLFFLVAAKWRPKEDFFPMQLSAAGIAMQQAAKPEPLLIQISNTETGCLVRIGSLYSAEISSRNSEAGLAEMLTAIRRCLLEQKRFAADPVEIICAPEVKWKDLADIYNVFVGTGLTDITFRMTRLGEDAAEAAGTIEVPGRSRTEVSGDVTAE